MADFESAVQKLKKKFEAPLPEFYSRRIVFWQDEDKAYEDNIGEVSIPNVKVVILRENNNFAVKKLLAHDDTISNYLVYCPIAPVKDEENWLLNLRLYGEEFSDDPVTQLIEQLAITNTPALRKCIKEYQKFFKSKERTGKVEALEVPIYKEAQLHYCVMAVLCGIKEATPNGILRAVFAEGLDMEINSSYKDFVTYGADKAFWGFVGNFTGYRSSKPSIRELAAHILLTAATRTLKSEYLAGLEKMYSPSHQAFCFDFISEWLNRRDDLSVLQSVALEVEDDLRLYDRFSKVDEYQLSDTECFPCINDCILAKVMKDICNNVIPTAELRALVEKRRAMVWYENTACYFEGVLQVCEMQDFYLAHAGSFHTVDAKTVWKEYTEDYYRMDTFYRQFHLQFGKSLMLGNCRLDDLFKHVTEWVEKLYKHEFLDRLCENWTTACSEDMKVSGRIYGVEQQETFYARYVKNSDSRVFVIISDALRYEVAATLAEQLRKETQSQVTLKSCQGIFPTITPFGMAALLPHSNLSVVEKPTGLQILADGAPTDAGNRDKVLKAANLSSVALKYKDLIALKRQERTNLVKGKEVVYIYHDKIDEASHTADSEVFPACEDAIAEIKNMVRIIANDFGGTNIYITADHGFIYTYSPMQEDSKVDKTTPSTEDVEIGRRYLIKRKGQAPEFLLPVRFMDGETDFEIFAPRDNIRIKKKGGGMNFVHGGLSLQEMCVPIIEYHFLRNCSSDYRRNREKYDTKPVTVNLYSAGRKIANLIFSLNFYQVEAVSDNREAATYLLYFTDSAGVQISDTQKIIADKTSQNTNERTFRIGFNLKSQKYSKTEAYYLIIQDESGLQAPQKIEFSIDISFAVDDIDW